MNKDTEKQIAEVVDMAFNKTSVKNLAKRAKAILDVIDLPELEDIIAELDDLSSSFDDMSESRQEKYSDLNDAVQTLKDALEAVAEGVNDALTSIEEQEGVE